MIRSSSSNSLYGFRNSIMHNAGVLKGYQHETDIRNEIAAYEPDFCSLQLALYRRPRHGRTARALYRDLCPVPRGLGITTYSSFAIEAVHFVVGDAIRRAGG